MHRIVWTGQPSAPVVRCRNLTKRFNDVAAVEEADLDVFEGELLCLLGPSGCGKTTLLRLIAGLEVPEAGRIMIDGRVASGSGVHVPPERRRVGMVFQDYALFPHLDVGPPCRDAWGENSSGRYTQGGVRKTHLEAGGHYQTGLGSVPDLEAQLAHARPGGAKSNSHL